jgi:hypothetical protein
MKTLHEIKLELIAREPIFHHPNKFGTTRHDILDLMCGEFWEVGASGKVYTKEEVIETLLERYADSNYQDIWEAKDFEIIEIAPNNYLIAYVLIQDKTRVTRRSTIWRYEDEKFKIVYHQGTIVNS